MIIASLVKSEDGKWILVVIEIFLVEFYCIHINIIT
jgi:hypothetical protein